ncbi:hypothetical protein VMCG_05503 [Cytospora schulzeri]|uniref:Uncharacterized protein n=1 Tax=Cytospora schulzeri TaxID=448051 RepID=A0A423WF03_9PEZI|nr:hypothetical protein VMCG_05503 [Valsa malicola]
MAPNLSEEEIDDLIYFARAGEVGDLNETLEALASREGVSPAEIIMAAKDEGKSTCVHWAAGQGHLDVVKYLVAEGASPALANDKNYVPLDLAGLNEKHDVVDYFLSQMEKMETGNGDEGLENATEGMEVGGDGADEDAIVQESKGKGTEGSSS